MQFPNFSLMLCVVHVDHGISRATVSPTRRLAASEERSRRKRKTPGFGSLNSFGDKRTPPKDEPVETVNFSEVTIAART